MTKSRLGQGYLTIDLLIIIGVLELDTLLWNEPAFDNFF